MRSLQTFFQFGRSLSFKVSQPQTSQPCPLLASDLKQVSGGGLPYGGISIVSPVADMQASPLPSAS